MKLFLTSYIGWTEKQLEEYTGYIVEGIKTFENLDFTVDILDITQENNKECDLAIASCNCLCISGGNTFYLLQELKKKKLIEFIKQRLTGGMLYIGESAGAVITSENIEYNSIMDNPNVATELKYYTGLNL
ncbi:Type 1 glutamine amidotransferase-like domain-containing protein [Streptococcus ferus]|uniref:Peptidase E n=1 Tax=Streptococcus ferus TaxID=1345 RepID=A0A2X3W0P8_9STRE|nr:Type 1 glutamine amidotransferase-like domain-containing protein [Streptococcus ferus]SQF39207.1 peptidase E [Streptococcus ferus]